MNSSLALLDDSLALLDDMIARQEQALAALHQARSLLAGDEAPPSRAVALLPSPARKARRRKADDEDLVVHEVDGVDVHVTPLQSAILDVLNRAEDCLRAAEIAAALGTTTPLGVKYAIDDLRQRLVKHGVPAEINGYRGKGFRLESPQAEGAEA